MESLGFILYFVWTSNILNNEPAIRSVLTINSDSHDFQSVKPEAISKLIVTFHYALDYEN